MNKNAKIIITKQLNVFINERGMSLKNLCASRMSNSRFQPTMQKINMITRLAVKDKNKRNSFFNFVPFCMMYSQSLSAPAFAADFP